MIDEIAIYDAALEAWGLVPQGLMLAEECSELSVAVLQWLRGRKELDGEDGLIQEMVDVDIMLGQIKRAINNESKWQEWREFKLNRLKGRLPVDVKDMERVK